MGRLLLVLLLAYSVTDLFAQAFSPYSRYGLGSLSSPVVSANKGMGGLSAAYYSAININPANPASYASLTHTTFDIGMRIDGANIHSGDSTYRATQVGVNHFTLALVPHPKRSSYAIVLGLLPYSNTNYTFIQNFNDSALGPFRQVYQGKGSLYQAFVGGAFKIKGFSFGANVGYLFGRLDYNKTITFPDSIHAYTTRNNTTMNLRSFIYSVGAQYQKRIYYNSVGARDERTDIFMTVGAYGFGGMNVSGKISSYWDRIIIDPTYGIIPADTSAAVFNAKVKLKLPFNVGGGIMFGNERYWMLGADFKYANWKNFSTPLSNGNLADSWRVSFGGQIIPKYDEPDKKKYFSRVQYRAGVYFGKSEITYAGNHLSETGGTVGLGLPYKASFFFSGHLNLSADFGSRGANDKAVIRENYYRVAIGFVVNDWWFNKRKFD
jgi:hypothetical protein